MQEQKTVNAMIIPITFTLDGIKYEATLNGTLSPLKKVDKLF